MPLMSWGLFIKKRFLNKTAVVLGVTAKMFACILAAEGLVFFTD